MKHTTGSHDHDEPMINGGNTTSEHEILWTIEMHNDDPLIVCAIRTP